MMRNVIALILLVLFGVLVTAAPLLIPQSICDGGCP